MATSIKPKNGLTKEAKKPARASSKKKPVNKPEQTPRSIGIYEDPKKDRILDLWVSPVSKWPVEAAVNALDNHERGNFTLSGKLSENMLRDSRIGSCLDTRVLGVLSLPFEWKFDKDPTEEDLGALEILEDFWRDILSDSIAASALRWTILMGFSIVNVYWDDIDGYWFPKLTVWHPSNSYYNIGTRKMNAFTFNQSVVELGDKERDGVDAEGDYRWMVFKMLDNDRPFMSGAIRRLAFSYLCRQYALNDWRGNSAVYGNPIRKLMATMEDAAQFDVYQFLKDIAERIRMGLPIMLPQGFDLQQLESTQHSPEMFKLLVDKCDTDIAISLLGQNLTTDSTTGNGSYALGTVHAKILQNYIEADVNMLQKTLYNQLIVPFYNFNFADYIQKPKPTWDCVPPEDVGEVSKGLLARSQSLVQLSSALSSFQQLGIMDKINLTELFREFRLPLNVPYNTPSVRG